MCGIAGILTSGSTANPEAQPLIRMLSSMYYWGPDENGIYLDERIGLGQVRLSIIDLDSGRQPLGNEDGTIWIVFNGEIFNYLELREELESRGHRFSTKSDTEVMIHLELVRYIIDAVSVRRQAVSNLRADFLSYGFRFS